MSQQNKDHLYHNQFDTALPHVTAAVNLRDSQRPATVSSPNHYRRSSTLQSNDEEELKQQPISSEFFTATPRTPNISFIQRTPSYPSTPRTTSIPSTPRTTSIPSTPRTMRISSTPRATSIPSTPRTPTISFTPRTMSIPSTPRTTSIPSTPRLTRIASLPRTQSIQSTPRTPSIISTSRNSSIPSTPTMPHCSTVPDTYMNITEADACIHTSEEGPQSLVLQTGDNQEDSVSHSDLLCSSLRSFDLASHCLDVPEESLLIFPSSICCRDAALNATQTSQTPQVPAAEYFTDGSPPGSSQSFFSICSRMSNFSGVDGLSDLSEMKGDSRLEGTVDSMSNQSLSDIFAELEDLAPHSDSSFSLDHPAGIHTDQSSPTTDLSSGLAALTVGCDSGDLGPLSRVQLLLLERSEFHSPLSVLSPDCSSPDGQKDLEPQNSGIPQYYQSRVLENHKPLSGRARGQDSLPAFKGRRMPPGLISMASGSRTSSSSSCVSESRSGNSEKCPVNDGTGTGTAPLPTGKKKRKITEEENNKILQIYSKLQDGKDPMQPTYQSPCSKFENFDFLAKYCLLTQEQLIVYKKAFETADSDGDGYLNCLQVLLALKEIVPPGLLSDEEEIYVYKILELVDFRVTEGLTDLRLFAVVASLAQKVATLDGFMRSLISQMDFRSLEKKLFKAKQLFLFLLEGQTEGTVTTESCITPEHLLVELKAGGIMPEHEAAVRQELRNIRSLDLLDFLAHLPLFILIHNSVITNPFNDSGTL